jgi:hypothetical protein
MPNDLQRRRAVILSKNMHEGQQMQQVLIQFISYVW